MIKYVHSFSNQKDVKSEIIISDEKIIFASSKNFSGFFLLRLCVKSASKRSKKKKVCEHFSRGIILLFSLTKKEEKKSSNNNNKTRLAVWCVKVNIFFPLSSLISFYSCEPKAQRRCCFFLFLFHF